MTRASLVCSMLLAMAIWAAWANPGIAAMPVRRVVGVEYRGVGTVSVRDLEGVLPFAPGDSWHERMPVNARQALVEYYNRRGFYHVNVEVHATATPDGGVVAVVKVDEGLPCVVQSIWINDPSGFKSKHVMLRFKSKMEDIVRMRPGDRYDEQVLADRARELREWLVAQDFILANTDKVRLSFNDDRTEVGVVLEVDYGDRITFGFQGNTIFTQAELSEMIDQIRATGLGKDYVGVIQRRFIEEYRARAYNNAKVQIKNSERPRSRHVTFVFSEGVRTQLTEVRWEGLTDQNVALAKEVFETNSSRIVQRGYFYEKDIDKVILLVLEDLKSRGYLSCKLIARSVQPLKAPARQQRVGVVIQIAEGEQTMVGKIDLRGFTYLSSDRVRETIGAAEGRPFNPFAFEEGLQRLRALYIGEGYLEFRVTTPDDDIMTFSDNNRAARIHLEAREGNRIHVGQIRFEGLQKTREYVVKRELAVREGDWWQGSAVQETELNIRRLGLFSEVKISPAPSLQGPGYRDMVIALKESEPGVFEIGPGYRSDLGLRAFTRLTYNNIFGRNWIGSLGASANRRLNSDYRFIEYQFDANFVEPRFFGTRNLYTIGLSTRKQRFPPDFNAVTTQFVTGFERKIIPQLTAKASYKLERIRQFDVYVQGQLSPDDNRSMLIGSLVPSLTFDTRDSPFTTTGGWLVSGSLEYADPRLSGTPLSDVSAPAYQKWTGTIHKYTAVTKDIVWSNVVSGGFARSNISGREIPLIKLFRLGGYSTIRGFPEDAINVDTQKITGTLTFLNLRTQIDLPLVGELKLAPFVDAGNLYIDAVRNNPFFRAGAGVGLHYMTPVGPINLDWGHKLNPFGDAPNQIHFSVGLI